MTRLRLADCPEPVRAIYAYLKTRRELPRCRRYAAWPEAPEAAFARIGALVAEDPTGLALLGSLGNWAEIDRELLLTLILDHERIEAADSILSRNL